MVGFMVFNLFGMWMQLSFVTFQYNVILATNLDICTKWNITYFQGIPYQNGYGDVILSTDYTKLSNLSVKINYYIMVMVCNMFWFFIGGGEGSLAKFKKWLRACAKQHIWHAFSGGCAMFMWFCVLLNTIDMVFIFQNITPPHDGHYFGFYLNLANSFFMMVFTITTLIIHFFIIITIKTQKPAVATNQNVNIMHLDGEDEMHDVNLT